MAKDSTWGKVAPYFKKHSTIDKWGNPDLIQDQHLLRLYDFREWVGSPIMVTAAVKSSGHNKNSFHYSRKDKKGVQIGYCATDVILPSYDESPFDLIMDASRFGFTGIGYYPNWRYKGDQVGGLHLDSRPLRWDSDDTLNYAHSRWMGVLKGDKQEYIELSFQNMMDYTNDEMDHPGGVH